MTRMGRAVCVAVLALDLASAGCSSRGAAVRSSAPAPGSATPIAVEPPRASRPLDPQPRAARLDPPLPPGKAEAFFALDTGRDQMNSGAPKDAGLMVIVRYGGTELRQLVASCREPALGSALGGGTETVLEVAGCDGEVHLLSRPGEVTVQRIDGGERVAAATLTRITLPRPEMRATSPAGARD